MQAPRVVSRAGIETTSRRRLRVSSSRASARARPMWPWLARAAYDANASSTPWLRTRNAGDLLRGGGGQGEQSAARSDRREHVLDRRRAEHPDGAGGRLLDRLEQRVAGLLGEPVGVLDDQDLPVPTDRRQRRAPDQVADLVDADGELLGADHVDVGVAAGQHRVAGVALAAAGLSGAALALQGRRERHGGVGASRARRAGEQPGMAHAVTPGRGPQRHDRPTLADEAVPDGQSAAGSTRSRTAAARSSTSPPASSTR